jgi:signal transduction histidine kinase
MRRLFPKSLVGQTILVMLVGLTLSHIISMTLYSSDRVETVSLVVGHSLAQRVAKTAHLVNESPLQWRYKIVSVLDDPTFRVSLTDENDFRGRANDGDLRSQVVRTYLEQQLRDESVRDISVRVFGPTDPAFAFPSRDRRGANARIGNRHRMMAPGGTMPGFHMMGAVPFTESLRVSMRLKDGGWLNFAAAVPESPSLWSSGSFLSMLSMAMAVIVFSVWVVRRVTRPLGAFAKAAEELGRDVHAQPLEERGPTEVRQASQAFNEMQERLKRLIENRTRMLAAISHDLRTPITLLRLRAEFIEDEDERAKTLATLEEMEAMIASTLSFARDDAAKEEHRSIDLASLIGSICNDMADAGLPVTFEPTGKLPYECRAGALKRAVTNLVENAIKYGDNATVLLIDSDGAVRILVEDQGPGIPESERETVFTPFYRIDPSRNRETGGVGLGLSVAQTIAHAHGGDITLENRTEGGLRATLTLPR